MQFAICLAQPRSNHCVLNKVILKSLHRPWPKNQNKCWYKTGSPPPAKSKNVVLKFRSVNNIVIAPANTGKDNNNKNAVIKIAQANKGSL